MPPVHDAVTAVLTLGDALFILRRQPHLQAFPGYWAFPGGKVDGEDGTEGFTEPLLQAHPPRLMRALLRELQEEVGVDLRAEIAAGRVRTIVCLGEATTPAFVPLRFRTWFFRIALTAAPEMALDAGEVAEAEWVPAARLRDRYARGCLLVVPPTLAVIERLAAELDAADVPNLAPAHPAEQVPWLEPLQGLRMLLVRSNTLPPAEHTNAILLGDPGAPRVLVDPSPANEAEMERLLQTLEEESIDEVFLTHHHPDHRQYADVLARRRGIPLGMSRDTAGRLARVAPAFLEGVEVRVHENGARLTEWLGQPVELLAVPGHDAGQLALLPRNRNWCLVGDLIQGIGTVVVGGPEGSMRLYCQSLERVIDLDPAVIVPSHGAALGTTFRLRETLAHRYQREAQVYALYEEGRSPEETVAALYPALDPRLLPLARINVESHLIKLREDGRIA